MAEAPLTSQSSIDDLLAGMSLREKVGQMTQITLHTLCRDDMGEWDKAVLDREKVFEAVAEMGVGSIFNVAGRPLTAPEWRALIAEIQEIAVGDSRLGIPILFGLDAVHGSGYTKGATLFPHNLSLAATWRPEFARLAARVTAQELKASGVPWNFAPVLDVGRQPLWSRFFETYGEDPLLASAMGREAIRGHADVPGVASCAKHYVAYSGPATGRDRTTAWVPDSLLRETYLPPFAAAVAAGAPTVMVNSGDVNGIPVHASRRLLTDVLRGELGFRGVIVSDWEDVIKLHTVHRVAPSVKEAVRMAVDAGIDMSMTPYDFSFAECLQELVLEGSVAEGRVDESVRRILELKASVGLFEEAVPHFALGDAGDRERGSFEAAAASLVLLENNGALPAPRGPAVAVAGAGADSVPALCGPWSHTWQGDDPQRSPNDAPTLRQAVADRFGDRLTGVDDASLVFLALAETPSVEKPGDINDLTLDADQQALAASLVATGKQVVAILLFDRPRVLGSWIDKCAAVIWAGRPGPWGGPAIADLVIGGREPEGRLPFTYPRHTGALIPYDHRQSDRLGRTYGLDPTPVFDGFDPRWRFGYGLSYTTFVYGGLNVCVVDGQVRVTVRVRNTGGRVGRETVQAYVTDLYASIAPAGEKLRGWAGITLNPGQEAPLEIAFPVASLSVITPEGPVLEPGDFELRVGDLTTTFEIATSG